MAYGRVPMIWGALSTLTSAGTRLAKTLPVEWVAMHRPAALMYLPRLLRSPTHVPASSSYSWPGRHRPAALMHLPRLLYSPTHVPNAGPARKPLSLLPCCRCCTRRTVCASPPHP